MGVNDMISFDTLVARQDEIVEDILENGQTKLIIYKNEPRFILIEIEAYRAQMLELELQRKLSESERALKEGRVVSNASIEAKLFSHG